MNKGKKIIISITSIVLVLLIIAGLTYAYFLTQIKGNTNEKSISVTTADLKLEYGDGNGFISLSNVLPNTTLTPLVTKTFTVSNKGNITVDYGVFLEDVINTFERVEDLDLKVECSSSINNKTCNGYDDIMLINNDMLFSNSIDENEIQTYTLTLDYKEKDVDQSVDMNKNVSAKVQIYGLNDTVNIVGTITDAENGDYVVVNSEPKKSEIIDGKYKVVGLTPGTHIISVYNNEILKYNKEITINKAQEESINGGTINVNNNTREVRINVSSDNIDIKIMPYSSNTLAYHIIDDALLNKNGTQYRNTPITTPAVEINQTDERELSIKEDDYGTSYYFRGNVENNYVNFAGMCWKILRIDGNGNVKIILEDLKAMCNDTEENDLNNDGIYYTGNWIIGGGNLGYVIHEPDSMTASDGTTTNSSKVTAMDYVNGTTTNQYNMSTVFELFQEGPLKNHLDKLASANWCINDKAYFEDESGEESVFVELTDTESYDKKVNGENFLYDETVRVYANDEKNPMLKCNGTTINKFKDNKDMYVGALTLDEISFAGGKINVKNLNYFLINSYQYNNRVYFWTLSPYMFYNSSDTAFHFNYLGQVMGNYITSGLPFRPVILLKNGTKVIIGDGTKSNPYYIN